MAWDDALIIHCQGGNRRERGGQIETYLTGLDEDGLQASLALSFIKLLYLLF